WLMCRSGPFHLILARHGPGELLQDAAPATALADPVAQRLAVDESIEVSVFELDPGPFPSLGSEPHLDLAGVLRIGVVLPRAVDLPGDDKPKRWLPCQHSAPVAF